MGIPQGSVIAPYLFNILLYDLPRLLSNNVVLVQYADDLCMWMKTTMKKTTPKRQLNYIRKVYQLELHKLSTYMVDNGLTLSPEKTNLVLFNNGADPPVLPAFKIQDKNLEYKSVVKFLGIFLTSKLTWHCHIEYLLNKARKSLNFIKVVSKQHWAQDVAVLKHLSLALIRSKLTYGQEVFFNAPKYLLKKLKSLDCKAFRLALGVPSHASSLGTYKEVGVLPLDENRELTVAKYVIRSSATENNIKSEISLRSEEQFPNRAKNICSLTTIKTFTSDLFKKSKLNPKEMQ